MQYAHTSVRMYTFHMLQFQKYYTILCIHMSSLPMMHLGALDSLSSC